MNLFARLFGSPAPMLNVIELQNKLKNGKRPFVLDVRQPEEFREGHIAGAKLIPLGELKNSLSDLPKQREIVCVCASGSRSPTESRHGPSRRRKANSRPCRASKKCSSSS